MVEKKDQITNSLQTLEEVSLDPYFRKVPQAKLYNFFLLKKVLHI